MALFRMKPHYRKRSKTLSYHGTASDLYIAGGDVKATSVGNYALFGGFNTANGAKGFVRSYNKSLTQGSVTSLSENKYNTAATTVGNYALFGGGFISSGDNNNSYTVDAYNKSLTKSTAQRLDTGRYSFAATTIGNYAMFGGGQQFGSSSATADMDVYDSSLTKLTNLTDVRLQSGTVALAATFNKNYALFGGGLCHIWSNKIAAFNASLTRSFPTDMTKGGQFLAATSLGDYALFGGGGTGNTQSAYSANIEIYDSSLTKLNNLSLRKARSQLAATTVKDFAIFAGGVYQQSGMNYIKDADYLTKELVLTIIDDLSVARASFAATSVGNYALFGGGTISGSRSAKVDVYEVA